MLLIVGVILLIRWSNKKATDLLGSNLSPYSFGYSGYDYHEYITQDIYVPTEIYLANGKAVPIKWSSKNDKVLDAQGNGSTLTLCATHKADNSEKNSSGEYIRKERSYGSYCRSFDILGIDENAIDAAYTNGILTLTLPKKEQHPESKRIEIK